MRPLDITAVAAYSDEIRISTPAILAALDTAERDRTNAEAVHEAYRLIHALKGAASMVGLAALGYLLNQSEELLDTVLTQNAPLSDELLVLLRETTPLYARYVDAALAGGSTDPVALDLAQAFRAYAGQPADAEDATLAELLETERRGIAAAQGSRPAPVAGDAIDAVPASEAGSGAPPDTAGADAALDLVPSEPIPQELAEVFAQEAQEHLQVISRLTAHLASSPEDRESLLELRRAVHTIKGAAGVVGYKAASRVAHRTEDLLDRLYEGTIALTPELIRLLKTSSDALDDVINMSSDPDALRASIGRLFAQYDAVGAQLGPLPVPAEFVPASSEEAAAAPGAPDAAAVPNRRSNVTDRRRNVEDRRGGQVVRVPFQRLSELVRLISELVVNRSSFDEHYAALIRQVEEVKLSTARLRRVALKLETDYEVRALAGNLIAPAASADTASSPGHGFDELEMDRYTDFHLVSRELTETATDIATISSRLAETIGNFDGDLTRLGRLTREVQDKVMEFRMVPLSTLAARLERTARVTAEECGKLVDFTIEGEAVALDKTLLEAMTDPLLHLLRNAVDHGIESPAARATAGKPDRGRILVRAAHEGTDVLIEVQDDGAGLDVERIRQIAVERGYMAEAEAASVPRDELIALVFEPGFSTAVRISEVSGRGVGLDIVRSKVNRLGGRIHIASEPGAGTTIGVRVPMTLAITRILLVRAGDQLMGLPLDAVEQIVRPDAGSLARVGAERVVEVGGRTYPLRDLASLLGLAQPSDVLPGSLRVLITNLGGRHVALAVDEIVQSRDAVVKSLGSHLRRVPGVWGATLLGDGTVILILNPADLAGSAEESRARVAHPRPAKAAERAAYTVLVVDDSLSMRHVLSSAVTKAGWNPQQARDGVEALELVTRAATPPDLILLDIEMPRMDGYELLSALRAQEAYRAIPVVMLTSRGGDKHREKAMALGATDYVVKPFQQEPLLQKIDALIRAAREGERKAAS